MPLELPKFRAELDIEHLRGQSREHIDIYANVGILQKVDNKYYGTGFLTIDNKLQIKDTINHMPIQCDIKEETLSIKMPERNLYMSLDVGTGKGGDKISNNEVLVWNGEMMNCSVLSLNSDGSINDYRIGLYNCDFDKIEVVGIMQ